MGPWDDRKWSNGQWEKCWQHSQNERLWFYVVKDVFNRAKQVYFVSFISENDAIPKCLIQSEC